jgi:serine/threonine-protein kinase
MIGSTVEAEFPDRFREVRMIHRLVILAALLAGSAAQAAPWRQYHNARFGVTADYPASWTMGPEPANDDGRVFTSPDGRARLTIFGHFVLDGREAEMAENEKGREGEAVAYRLRKANWIVRSGTRGGAIFYSKALISCRDTVWNGVDIEYPASEKEKYDALVAHVAASLKPGAGYQTDCK